MVAAADLAVIHAAVEKDRAMAGVPRDRVRGALERVAAPQDDESLLLAAMRLFALAGNGHTRLIPNAAARVFPIRLVWAGDGLWSGTEGRRVTHVNDAAVEDLHARLLHFLAGTTSRQRVIGGLPLAWSPALVLSGAMDPKTTVAYRFSEGPDRVFGEADRIPAAQFYPVSEQGFPGPGSDPYPPVKGVLRLPSFSPGLADAPEARITGVLEELERHRGPLVVDLRGNAGGDFILHLPILDRIEGLGVPVTVLIDRFTFSAAIVFAALCRERLSARIVGEAAGDGLQFWAEGGTLQLPASGAAIRYSDGWHDWETGRATSDTPSPIAREMRACQSIAPDISVVTTPEDIRHRDDPALDAAKAGHD